MDVLWSQKMFLQLLLQQILYMFKKRHVIIQNMLKDLVDALVSLSQLMLNIKLCCCFQRDLASLLIPHKVTAGKIYIVSVILQVKNFRKKRKFMRLGYRQCFVFFPNSFQSYSRIHGGFLLHCVKAKYFSSESFNICLFFKPKYKA